MRSFPLTAAIFVTGLALPAAAQIVVVPLDPMEGYQGPYDGALDGGFDNGLDNGLGSGFGNGGAGNQNSGNTYSNSFDNGLPPEPDEATGLFPAEPVTGFEPLPQDPGTDWQPQLDPVDPDAVQPWVPLIETDPLMLNPLPPGSVVGEDVTTVAEDAVTTGTGAVLKGLDKLAGTVVDLELATGQSARLGWLDVTLGECRYPVDNPSGDAYAWVEINEDGANGPAFRGWMIASSPGLSALDHARFDVWVVACKGAETVAAEAAE